MKKIRFLTCTLFSVIMIYNITYANTSGLFKSVIEREVEVTAAKLNLRTGPGYSYPVVGIVESGQRLEVIGTLDNWYLVLLPDGSIGVISYQYVKVTKMGENIYTTPDTKKEEGADNTDLDEKVEKTESDAEKMFDLINNDRLENNLTPFVWDEKLNRIAEIKAKDMAENDYFDHNSSVYGTPFAMLKQMEVLYLSASENIARNNSVENAHLELMSSVQHRVNILSARFNKVGIGIYDRGENGKIIVQLFIEE